MEVEGSMKRDIDETFRTWKKEAHRYPLLVHGARRTGSSLQSSDRLKQVAGAFPPLSVGPIGAVGRIAYLHLKKFALPEN